MTYPRTLAVLLLWFYACNHSARAQAPEASGSVWAALSKVTFKSSYNPETGEVAYLPIFGREVKALEGKTITLQGYIVPVQSHVGAVILSAFPFSSCYFCGQAGPETVAEVYPKRYANLAPGNKPVTLRGRLELNATDLLHLTYILREAELVNP